MNKENLAPDGLPEDAGDEVTEERDALREAAEAAWESEGGNPQDNGPQEAGPGMAEGSGDQAGVQVGLAPLGPMIQVTAPDGTVAQKYISVEECFLLAGQLTGLGGFVMNMGMQAQMQEQAKIQALMKQGEEQTKSGLYVKKS